MSDLGGEFMREFSNEVELMGTKILNTAAISPTQNALLSVLVATGSSTPGA